MQESKTGDIVIENGEIYWTVTDEKEETPSTEDILFCKYEVYHIQLTTHTRKGKTAER